MTNDSVAIDVKNWSGEVRGSVVTILVILAIAVGAIFWIGHAVELKIIEDREIRTNQWHVTISGINRVLRNQALAECIRLLKPDEVEKLRELLRNKKNGGAEDTLQYWCPWLATTPMVNDRVSEVKEDGGD